MSVGQMFFDQMMWSQIKRQLTEKNKLETLKRTFL